MMNLHTLLSSCPVKLARLGHVTGIDVIVHVQAKVVVVFFINKNKLTKNKSSVESTLSQLNTKLAIIQSGISHLSVTVNLIQ